MFQDYKDLFFAFHAHGVKYLIVGGYAVTLYSQPSFANDLDILIEATDGNGRSTHAALAEFCVQLEGVSPEDFEDRGSFFRFGPEPHGFDLYSDIPGVEFDTAWQRRVEGVVDEGTGLKALFISKDDLIAAKMVSGRLSDLADVAAIRAARNIEDSGTIIRLDCKGDKNF